MAFYDSDTYDSGARYDEPAAPLRKHTMAKVKLELEFMTDEQVFSAAKLHKTKMTGNAKFASPIPTAAIFDQDLADYGDSLDWIKDTEAALKSRRALKETQKAKVKTNMSQRRGYVDSASKGVAEDILTTGFDIQSDRVPTTSLPRPQNLIATIGDNAGEIDLGCDAVKKAQSYIWECREHVDGQVAGAWSQVKVGGRSTITATGLVSGRKYAFRVRALGPNETESPWSDEAVCMAA